MTKKILLADDSITIQKVVELTFSDGDYEVIATNNGAKAIQKLSELRPDIILSDIIMPEKNGYEVCEFVKSHPEFRSIPVILLTGTFEPFDPDRAEKAGCDAVVTKPFESQSLIHKVEELISQSRSAAPAATAAETAPAAPEFGAGFGDTDEEPQTAPSAPAGGVDDGSAAAAESQVPEWPAPPKFDFGAAPEEPETSPFASPANENPFGSDTSAAAESPLDQTFPSPRAMQPPGFGAPSAPVEHGNELFGGGQSSSVDQQLPFESSADDEAAAPEFGRPGETLAFPKMSFDDLQRLQQGSVPSVEEEEPAKDAEPFAAAPETPAPFPPPSPMAAPEPPAFGGGETLAFPKMSFDDLRRMQEETSSAPTESPADPWTAPPSPPPSSPDTSWSPKSPAGSEFGSDAFSGSSSPFAMGADALAFDAGAPQPPPADEESTSAPDTPAASIDSSRSWSMTSAESVLPKSDSTPAAPAAQQSEGLPRSQETSSELSDAQIERIAKRVVEMLSDQVVRNIAWEVIPDIASAVVKERIKQLENE